MNECMDREIQEMLPDVLHGTLNPPERARVEAHLSGCNSCKQELAALEKIHAAAVFVPSIDAEAIVRQLPPYRIITPERERAVRTPVMKWLVAAGFALIAVGGGSFVMREGEVAKSPAVAIVPAANGLALASGLDGLSDGSLVQLMNEMNTFDALPNTEPEGVFVDAASSTEEDSL